jgi:hypothetical protein
MSRFILFFLVVVSVNSAIAYIPTDILTDIDENIVANWGWQQVWSGVSDTEYSVDEVFSNLEPDDYVMLAVKKANTNIYQVAAAAPYSVIDQKVPDPSGAGGMTSHTQFGGVAWYNHNLAMGFNPFTNEVTSHIYNAYYGSERSNPRVMSWLKTDAGNTIASGGRVGINEWSTVTQLADVADDWTRVVLKYTNNIPLGGLTNSTEIINFNAVNVNTTTLSSGSEELFSDEPDVVVAGIPIYGNFWSSDEVARWVAAAENGSGLKIRYQDAGFSNQTAYASFLFSSDNFLNGMNFLEANLSGNSTVSGRFGYINFSGNPLAMGSIELIIKDETGWNVSESAEVLAPNINNGGKFNLDPINGNRPTFSFRPADLDYVGYDPYDPDYTGPTNISPNFKNVEWVGFRLKVERQNSGSVNFGVTEFQVSAKAENPDYDNDGILDNDENLYGTDPLLKDTDADGITDGAEVFTYLTDPLDSDMDLDTILDGEEIFLYGTSPTNFTDLNNSNESLGGLVMISWDPSWSTPEFNYFTNYNTLIFKDASEKSVDNYIWNPSLKLFNDQTRAKLLYLGSDTNIVDVRAEQGTWYNFLEQSSSLAGQTFIQYDASWDLDFDGTSDGVQIQQGRMLLITNYLSLITDVDGDNLLTYEEAGLGTNPRSNDSDGDGLEDDYEIFTSLSDPLDVDSDDDTYTDFVEDIAGSDPNNFDDLPGDLDFDGDGLTNEDELFFGTDRRNVDSDDDGIIDFDEVYIFSTNPLDADSDDDGLDDSRELMNSYQLINTINNSYYGSKNDAINRGGYLATITTTQEWNHIQHLVNSTNITYFLGGNDSNGDGQWIWDTGEDWTVDFWFEGQPSSNIYQAVLASSHSDSENGWINKNINDSLNYYLLESNRVKSNPNDADSDDDGLSDYDEVMNFGTNPNTADTDGDGFNDKFEIEFSSLTITFDEFSNSSNEYAKLSLAVSQLPSLYSNEVAVLSNEVDTLIQLTNSLNGFYISATNELLALVSTNTYLSNQVVFLSNEVATLSQLTNSLTEMYAVASNDLLNITVTNALLSDLNDQILSTNSALMLSNSQLISTNEAYGMLDAAYIDDVIVQVSNNQAMLIMSIEQSSNLTVEAWESGLQVTNMIPIDADSEVQFFKFDVE